MVTKVNHSTTNQCAPSLSYDHLQIPCAGETTQLFCQTAAAPQLRATLSRSIWSWARLSRRWISFAWSPGALRRNFAPLRNSAPALRASASFLRGAKIPPPCIPPSCETDPAPCQTSPAPCQTSPAPNSARQVARSCYLPEPSSELIILEPSS